MRDVGFSEEMVGRGVLDPPQGDAARPEAAPYHVTSLPTRRRLPHVAPFCVDTRGAIYFITICAVDRVNADWVGRGVLDPPPPASTIISAAKHYHEIGRWFLHLILVMPECYK